MKTTVRLSDEEVATRGAELARMVQDLAALDEEEEKARSDAKKKTSEINDRRVSLRQKMRQLSHMVRDRVEEREESLLTIMEKRASERISGESGKASDSAENVKQFFGQQQAGNGKQAAGSLPAPLARAVEAAGRGEVVGEEPPGLPPETIEAKVDDEIERAEQARDGEGAGGEGLCICGHSEAQHSAGGLCAAASGGALCACEVFEAALVFCLCGHAQTGHSEGGICCDTNCPCNQFEATSLGPSPSVSPEVEMPAASTDQASADPDWEGKRCEHCGRIDGGHSSICPLRVDQISLEDYEAFARSQNLRNPKSWARRLWISCERDGEVKAWMASLNVPPEPLKKKRPRKVDTTAPVEKSIKDRDVILAGKKRGKKGAKANA